jgi:MFS family permease
MLSSYLGVAAGQVAINIPDDSGFNIYVLTSIFFSVSLIPLALTRIMSPEIATTESISLKKLYKKAPVGVVGCLASGLLTSVFYTITPIYASISNMDIKQTSFFMATCTIGGMFFQMPMGKFSDTRDRRLIILFSSIMLILFAIVMMFSNSIPMIVAYGIMFLYGGMMFTYYPLSVSHINDVLTEDERVTATGGMALSYGIGAVTGPVIATFFMSTLGAWAFFLYSTIVVGSFTGVTVLELKKKPKMDYEEQTPTEPIHAARVSNVVEVSEEFQGL